MQQRRSKAARASRTWGRWAAGSTLLCVDHAASAPAGSPTAPWNAEEPCLAKGGPLCC